MGRADGLLVRAVSKLERIKLAANKRDVPYQSLMKTWLAEKVAGN